MFIKVASVFCLSIKQSQDEHKKALKMCDPFDPPMPRLLLLLPSFYYVNDHCPSRRKYENNNKGF